MSLYKKNVDEIIINKVNSLDLGDMYTLTLFLIMKDNKETIDLLLKSNCIKNKLEVECKNFGERNLDDLID